MSATRAKAQGFTKQVIGEMIGDQLLVREGKEQLQHADDHGEAPDHREEPSPPSPSQSPPESRREP